MTCRIDHDAEDAIPMFLCAVCNGEAITEKKGQSIEMADARCVAPERVQALQPAAHLR
jgi:Ni2+-binding GTPase involved in maturation of urease and hydrogenase